MKLFGPVRSDWPVSDFRDAHGVKTAQALLRPTRSSGGASGHMDHQSFRNEARRSGGGGKGTSRHADRNNTVHGSFDLFQSVRARFVGNRPLLQQPVFDLFDRAEFLHVPVRRQDKGKGLPPVDFDQRDIFLKG